MLAVLVATVGQAQQEQMPGEGGTDRGDAVDAGDQQPRWRVQGDVGVAEVERDRAARGQGGQDPGIPGRLVGSAALFGQDGDGGHGHEGLEAEWPQPGQDGAEAGGLGDGVEDVEAEGGAVGEHGGGAQPARHLDGAVDAVAVLVGTGGHAGSFLGCWTLSAALDTRPGPRGLVIDG